MSLVPNAAAKGVPVRGPQSPVVVILEEMMPDTTHPSEKGHEVGTKAIAPELKKMLGK